MKIKRTDTKQIRSGYSILWDQYPSKHDPFLERGSKYSKGKTNKNKNKNKNKL